MNETRVDVGDISVAFERHGEGVPILLVHGWSADRNYMLADLEPVFEEHRGWQRTYLDLPGHGATRAPERLSTQEQVMEVLRNFIDAVLPPGPFAIAGNSYGGYLALGLVRTIRERLSGAALLVPDVPAPDGSRDTPPPITLVEDPSIFTGLEPDEAWIPEALVEHDARMLNEIRAHDMPAYRIADRAFLDRLESHYLLTGVAGRPGAPFEGPSLIVAGRQDATVGYRGAWGLLDEFPRATYAVLDLGGHHVGRVERPELFRALVGDWLERVRPAPGG